MSSRIHSNGPGASLLIGLAAGLAVGAAAALLAAPMNGRDMRHSIRRRASDGGARLQSLATTSRSWAQDTLERGLALVEEARRAFNRRYATATPLRATVGEVASMHSGGESRSWEVTS